MTVKRSTRAKYMRLRVGAGGSVTLTVPHYTGERAIGAFLVQHANWLERAVERMRDYRALPVSGRRAYLAHRERARAFVAERLEYWNQHYGFAWGRLAIKDQRTMWGSCSKKGNLNFSYALLFLPRPLADYVVVHELCHLKEHNHSRRFWALVEQTIPDHTARRMALREYILK